MYQDENMLLQSIYEEYQGPLRRVARSFNVPDMEVDDVIQETFIAYFERYSLTWTSSRKKAMLMKILKSKSIDCLRKHSHYEQVSLNQECPVQEIELLTRFIETDPLDIIVGEEGITRINLEIENMRKEWKEIAILYFLEQRTIPEICEILDIPGTVCRSRIYRVRICLKKILKPLYEY